MKRTTAILITVLMLCVTCMTVFAETSEQKGAAIKTTVPSTCVVTFIGIDGIIEENGIAVHEQETYKRKSIHTFTITPDSGKEIDKLFFGGADVTDQLISGAFTTLPLTKDTVFEVKYKDASKPAETSSKTQSEEVSSKTQSEEVSSKTQSEEVSSKTQSEEVSSKTQSENVSSKTASVNTSSTADNISPKTGDRGVASTGGAPHAGIFAAAAISAFILIFAASGKKKRKE